MTFLQPHFASSTSAIVVANAPSAKLGFKGEMQTLSTLGVAVKELFIAVRYLSLHSSLFGDQILIVARVRNTFDAVAFVS